MSRGPSSQPDSNGTTSQAMTKEIASAPAMVTASARKNEPVMPFRNASGVKMMMVEADDPISGWVNSRAAYSTRVDQDAQGSVAAMPARMRQMTCSTMTMVSSMISPTAAAAPPSVITFRPIPGGRAPAR